MIPRNYHGVPVAGSVRPGPRGAALLIAATLAHATLAQPVGPPRPASGVATSCLANGGGYLRARIGGALHADIDWPNRGTWCAGEPQRDPAGVRVSFRRVSGRGPRLLFLFGLTGVREGRPLREGRVNLTVIDESDGRIYGTLGDRRCTLDSLSQRRLPAAHTYRLEARGFCTEPARAVRGAGHLLVSRFDFAAPVSYAKR